MKKLLSMVLFVSMLVVPFGFSHCDAAWGKRESSTKIIVNADGAGQREQRKEEKKKAKSRKFSRKVVRVAKVVGVGAVLVNEFSNDGKLGRYLGTKAAIVKDSLNNKYYELKGTKEYREFQNTLSSLSRSKVIKSAKGLYNRVYNYELDVIESIKRNVNEFEVSFKHK